MSRFRNVLTALGLVCVTAIAGSSGVAGGRSGPSRDTAAATTPPESPPVEDTPTSGADPEGYAIQQQQPTTVFEPGPNVIAAAPLADAFDAVDANGRPTRSVLLSWTENSDVATVDGVRPLITSADHGYTFPSAQYTGGIGGFYAQLHDGTILGVGFIPATVIDAHTAQLTEQVSRDGGKTWQTQLATFTTDKTFDPTRFNRGLRVDRDITPLPNGDLLLTYYTAYQGESAGTSELAISHDQGGTWQRYATIFPPQGTRTFNETAVSYNAAGDLVAVARSHVGSTLTGMYTSRSTDDGLTWSPATPVQIATATGDPAPVTGIMPDLRLLPNGVLALLWGRPDNWVAISPDGLGTTFVNAQVIYHNYPDQDTGAYQRSHGSSGNGALAVVNSNRVLAVGDNCAASWGCPPADSGYQVDGKYRVWKKFVDVVTPGVGKIDLLDKYLAGTVTVSTDLTSTQRRLPEMRPVGAIDGSTDWGSSAVRKSGQGPSTYTVTLDKTYTLTKAGLSLHPGQPSSATVDVSTDGTSWQTVVNTGALTSYALTYFAISGVPAKYVRVTVNDHNTDRSGSFLNEVELYSTVDSFANDAVGYVPRGYTDAVGATVTDINTPVGEAHALLLADAWNDKIAQARWVSAAAPTQDLSFQFSSIGYARTFQFVTNGTLADGSTANAYQVAVMSDGSIAWYNAATKAWTKLTPPGAVPLKTWHTIRVSATLAGAQVSLDGTVVGTAPPTTPGVTALTGHTFSSSSTTSSQDTFVIDDVVQS
ncbi:MAG TPA: discoidin domain-containing protein [Jatrophihabitantaceae bacterium]|jgi:hypothetical protein